MHGCTSAHAFRRMICPTFAATLVAITAGAALAQSAPAVDPNGQVASLIERMTLEEKIGQLNQLWGGEQRDFNPNENERKLEELFQQVRLGRVGTFLGARGAAYTNRLQRVAVEESRLKIPLLLANDIIHGCRTIFPIPLAEASTWNPELIEAACRVAAREARAMGTHWTFAPMIDIARDARWGRIAEGAGEDPLLGARIAAARVRGFQGTDLRSPDSVMACAKHFAAYGASEAGRDYNTVDISLQTLHEVHLPPFRAAVEASVGSFMSAFNEINGVPATADETLMRRILRGQWGFEGIVISDHSAVKELILHGFAADRPDAGALALRAGIDIDMCSEVYIQHAAELVRSGRVSEKLIDEAVARVLRAKIALGLFDQPYTDVEREAAVTLTPENRALAREIAGQSIVLLKNEGGMLPLAIESKRVALIGPLVEARTDALGSWHGYGDGNDVVTIPAGLKAAAPQAEFRVVSGSGVKEPLDDGVDQAVAAVQECDLVVLVLGEEEKMSGEGGSRASIDLPQPQLDLAKAVLGVGKPTIVVLMAGRPLTAPWLYENAAAIVMLWQPGTECGNALADVLLGRVNPSGHLPITFPRATGQLPMYYAHKNTGRPPRARERYCSRHIDVHWTPQFPFGFGLSYTTFAYADLSVQPEKIAPDGTVNVSVKVSNTGERDGVDVVQLYVRDPVASMTRPVRLLRGFERVSLAAGESKTVQFTLAASELGFYDREMNYVVEPGAFEVYVGGDSTATLKAAFEVAAP